MSVRETGRGRPWTKQEEGYIRRHYQTEGAGPVAAALGRSSQAVNDRAKLLGIRSARSRPWTDGELRYLARNYPRRSAEQIAKTLGRSLSSVRGQIHLQGLGSEPYERWRAEEIELLKHEYGRMRISELARSLGRSPYAVQLKAGKLGLQRKVRHAGPKESAWIIARLGQVALDEMARQLGIPSSAVRKIAREHGYSPKAHQRRWTHAEDQLIRKQYRRMTAAEIAAALGRSPDMVSWRTRKLGLTSSETRKLLRWTDEEEALLLTNAGRLSRPELAERLGRTIRAVEGRIEKLKKEGRLG